MTIKTGIIAMSIVLTLYAQSWGQSTGSSLKKSETEVAEEKQKFIGELTGTWQIDLRPLPDAAPYLKEFVVSDYKDGTLSGTFYDTPFSDGKVNTRWGKIYFAFTTADNSGVYYHSGSMSDGKVSGTSFSTGRKFLQPWFSVMKK